MDVKKNEYMVTPRGQHQDMVNFASTLTGLDFRYYAEDRELLASNIKYQTPALLESADGLTDEIFQVLLESEIGRGSIHTDRFARSWACAGIGEGFLTAGPFLLDDDSESSIAGILRLSRISHTSQAEYYRSLPIRDDSGASALVRLILLLGNGVPSADRVDVQPLMIAPVHDPSLEDRFRVEQKKIENLYAIEKRILNIVSSGDREGLRQIESQLQYQEDSNNRFGSIGHLAKRMPDNPLRLQRNLSIALNTLLRQAAGNGGLSPLSLHGISERFALLIERSENLESIGKLRRDMIRTYTDAVRRIGVAGHSRPVRRALQYVNDNLDGRFFLKDLAAESNLHPVSLSRLFRKETGITLTSFIRKRRMEEARWLLSSSGYSNADTALMVGYDDPGAFSKAFKRETGMTPGKYRSMET